MESGGITDDDLYRFILLQIDTVPHLEGLLLIWRSRPRPFTETEIATQLFVDTAKARSVAGDLVRAGLIVTDDSSPSQYLYASREPHLDALMEALAQLYRRDLVNISKLIHSKAPSAARDFARAFKFTKDRD